MYNENKLSILFPYFYDLTTIFSLW